MAITYGFFNSINSDRRYNADQISEYFDGLVSNGVYESVGNALQVTAGDGLAVNVQSGRAIIESKWIKNDAAQTVNLTASHVLLPRYTAIVVRLNKTNRLIEIAAKDGTPASSPAKPEMADDGTIKELCLAYVYVGANTSAVTQANIIDMRASNLCGWVTGIIQQVNTSQLFAQWQAAYEQYYAAMQAWQQSMQSDFNTWFEALTDQLSINTYIAKFSKRTVLSAGTEGVLTSIILDMEGYTYAEGDIIEVFINGLYGSEGVDYQLTTEGTPVVTPHAWETGTVININVYQSKIGFISLVTNEGDLLVTSDNEEITT